jgi:hypothetical protein
MLSISAQRGRADAVASARRPSDLRVLSAPQKKVAVSTTLPADVRLSPVPADWGPGVTKYQYFNSDNHVFLAEPSSHKVITEID